MPKAIDITGLRSGRLTAVQKIGSGKNGVLWECVCECGSITNVPAAWMKAGTKKSCGCLHALPEGEANFNKLYYMYKDRANKKDISFTLTVSMFRSLTKSVCHYCGAEPGANFHAVHSNGSYIYNGIDRKDNDLGYMPNNVVPCCSRCNVAKKAMPYEEFLGFVKSIYEHLNLQK